MTLALGVAHAAHPQKLALVEGGVEALQERLAGVAPRGEVCLHPEGVVAAHLVQAPACPKQSKIYNKKYLLI